MAKRRSKIHDAASAHRCFSTMRDILEGGMLSPESLALLQDIIPNYEWLLQQFEEKDDEISRIKKALNAALADNHASQEARIPPNEWTDAQKIIYQRIQRLTGLEIPKDRMTNDLFNLSSSLLDNLYVRDPLTGLHSYRIFSDTLSTLIRDQSADTHELPYTVVMCDINKFKPYNSTLTHPVADEVLKRIASFMRQRIAQEFLDQRDLIISRRSGDEFLLILPDTTQKRAQEIMHALNQELSHIIFDVKSHGKTLNTIQNASLSYGCYQLGTLSTPDTAEQVEQCVAARMYKHKSIMESMDRSDVLRLPAAIPYVPHFNTQRFVDPDQVIIDPDTPDKKLHEFVRGYTIDYAQLTRDPTKQPSRMVIDISGTRIAQGHVL